MDTTPNAAQPKARRRWYQYSLRTLLIVVTLAGCGFAWLGVKVREARQQEAAVAAIEKLGGQVLYDYQLNSQGAYVIDATLPGPAWLHALLGDDIFRSASGVSFFRYGQVGIPVKQVSDSDSELLKGLTTLKRLDLTATQVTDAGLENLRGLANLEVLDLTATQVTDAGVISRLEQDSADTAYDAPAFVHWFSDSVMGDHE